MSARRVFGLDALRAIAIGCVVVYHGRFFVAPHIADDRALDVLGYLGVELFFVLSGFLIGGLLLDQGRDLLGASGLWHFWGRRWFRTLPNYFLFLLINLAVAGWIGTAPPPAWRYATFTQSLAWRIPEFFRPSWSLAVEEWFYLVLPIAIVAGAAVLRSAERAVLAAATLFVIVPAGLREIVVRDYAVGWWTARHVTILHLDPLMFGVLAAWVKRRTPEAWARLARPAAYCGAATVLAGAACLVLFDPNQHVWLRTGHFSLVALSLALLLPLADQWRPTALSAPAQAVRRLAAWSYALYLTHSVVYEILLDIFPPSGDHPLWRDAALVPPYLILSVAAAGAVYRWYEAPLLLLRDRVTGLAPRSPHPARGRTPAGSPERQAAIHGIART